MNKEITPQKQLRFANIFAAELCGLCKLCGDLNPFIYSKGLLRNLEVKISQSIANY
jgi:hypothetical protein